MSELRSPTKELKLIIAGIGGQGVIYATKVLSQAALARGETVMASENHGMSQRGGSVLTHFKIGGSEAPLIRRGTADTLVAFDRIEALRNLSFVRPGGQVFVNSPGGLDTAVIEQLQVLGIHIHTVDANACAKELGAQATANLVVLGFAAAHDGLGLSVANLKEAVHVVGPSWAVEVNARALDVGVDMARNGQGEVRDVEYP